MGTPVLGRPSQSRANGKSRVGGHGRAYNWGKAVLGPSARRARAPVGEGRMPVPSRDHPRGISHSRGFATDDPLEPAFPLQDELPNRVRIPLLRSRHPRRGNNPPLRNAFANSEARGLVGAGSDSGGDSVS